MRKRSIVGVAALMLSIMSLALSGCTQTDSTAVTSKAQAATTSDKSPRPSPTSSGPVFEYGRVRNLVGASPQEVGHYAQQYAQAELSQDGSTTIPQVLLSRPIVPAEMASLGMGCIYFGTIEEPPLMLVILKGDFDLRGVPGGGMAGPSQVEYMGLTFDIWSARVTHFVSSPKGGFFQGLLNDSTIQEDYPGQREKLKAQQTASCREDKQPRTMHYGDTASTAIMPNL